MAENRNVFALLIGVGDYEKMNIANLATYRMDLAMLGTALRAGLKVPEGNIRFMAGEENNGRVTTQDLAKGIAGFKSILGSEDVFILYFSGHGKRGNIIFSNGQVELQSIIDYVSSLPAKSKIVIMDCCYSGAFQTAGAREMSFYESMEEFAGRGMAVLASSASDEVSRLGPNGNHSMFTGALSSAMTLNKSIRKGMTTLQDICDETMRLVRAWNHQNPGKEQQPIFRSSMGGTIFFWVRDYRPYVQTESSYETERYLVTRIEPLHTNKYKRFAVFVILKDKVQNKELAVITKEITNNTKYSEIYADEASETRYEGIPASAIWCYFGLDNSDLVNHRYWTYTVWADDEDGKRLYYKTSNNALEQDGIMICPNKSYELLRKMQTPEKSRDECVTAFKTLLATIVTLAEKFIADMQEVANRTMMIDQIRSKYRDWIIEVRKRYIELSDEAVPPEDLYDWTEEIMTLAGWVMDMAILMEPNKETKTIGERELWLIANATRLYRESMEKLKILEEDI